MRQVLIISPYFPPSTLAGVHRARHLGKHLPMHGWKPIILCVDECFHEQKIDPELTKLVDGELEIIKIGAIPYHITRPFGLGEISLRAWRQLRVAIDRIVRTRRIDVALITGSPFYPMLFAKHFKQHGIPVILDFQDPWVSAWGMQQPLWRKAGMAHWLARRLEPLALRHADYVTSVSETQNREMAARYPWLDASRMAAIPIGGDPADFEHLRAKDANQGSIHFEAGKVQLCYVGTFLPRAAPLIKTLFQALAALRQAQPGLANRLALTFIGTSNQPDGQGAHLVKPFAEAVGVGDLVREFPARIPYLEALSVLAWADGLLLIGSDEPHYTASKIYPALLSGRPYLSLFHKASSAHDILTRAEGGRCFAFSTMDELALNKAQLEIALADVARDEDQQHKARLDVIEPYTAHAVAGRFAGVFNGYINGNKF